MILTIMGLYSIYLNDHRFNTTSYNLFYPNIAYFVSNMGLNTGHKFILIRLSFYDIF